jgi:hypothetical protein
MNKESDNRSLSKKMSEKARDVGIDIVDDGADFLGDKIKGLLRKAITVGSNRVDIMLDSDTNKITKTELKDYLKVKKIIEENIGKELPKLSEKEVEELSVEEFQEYFTKVFGSLWVELLYSAFEDGLGYGEKRKEHAMAEAMKKNGFTEKQIELVTKDSKQVQRALDKN